MKMCLKCEIVKPFEDFALKRSSIDGVESSCKLCRKEYKAAWAKRNKDRIAQKRKQYVLEHRDSIRAYKNQWQRDNPERMRDAYLWSTYRIRSSEYNLLLESQSFSCAICFTHQDILGEYLVVDHDHSTGVIRGLLCPSCNKGLGLLRDSKDILSQALTYLS